MIKKLKIVVGLGLCFSVSFLGAEESVGQHKGYTLSSLRPDGFEPKVAG